MGVDEILEHMFVEFEGYANEVSLEVIDESVEGNACWC